ncbi:MAG: hypothetical protein WA895_07185, partial [Streptosporangiaceae bacterium]
LVSMGVPPTARLTRLRSSTAVGVRGDRHQRPCTPEHRTRAEQHHGQHTVAHSTPAPRPGTPVRASSRDNADTAC